MALVGQASGGGRRQSKGKPGERAPNDVTDVKNLQVGPSRLSCSGGKGYSGTQTQTRQTAATGQGAELPTMNTMDTDDSDFPVRRNDSPTNSSSSFFMAPPPPQPRNRVTFGTAPQYFNASNILNFHPSNADNSDVDEEEGSSNISIDDIHIMVPNRAAPVRNPRDRQESDDDDDDDSDEQMDVDSHEVVTSIFWKGSKLGAAVYNAETSEVSILADLLDLAPQFTITKSLLLQTNPSQLVTCARLSETFVTILKEYCGPDLDAAPKRCYLNLLSSSEYKHEFIKSRILAMRLPSEPEASKQNDESHLHYIHSLIDLNNDCSVYAFGALLKFLDKSWANLNLEARDQVAPIVAVKKISLVDNVCIDLDTFTALQIFSNHSVHGVGRGKSTVVSEGLSLFALFNRCKSTLGCRAMRMMMLKPTNNFTVLNERQDVIEFCNQTNNKSFVTQILDHMRNVKGVLRILTKLKAAQPTVKDWKSLVKISDCLSDDLYRVGQSINTIMDMNESEKTKRFVVRAGVDAYLDKKKQEYSNMQDLLSSVAEHELANLPAYISECTVNYIPEMGFMLAIPLWSPNLEEKDLEIPDLHFLFISDMVAHYKTARCKELDRVLGDVLTHIMEKETEIMVRLIQFVEKKIHSITEIMDLLAEFDCLTAMAAVAQENNYVRPVLTKDRVMDVKDGRHPLQELCVSDYVPNDIEASEKVARMKILTGPNASGKSVYLKQVALISYMAHIGSFVPATSAKISLFSEIFTRIKTVESVSSTLSAFMIDLRQMALALQCSSPNSLIVIDEFGKGTSELDGLALLAASLNNLLKRKEKCPLVLISTHFHSVADLLTDQSTPIFQKLTLDHLCNDREVIYLHKLKEGGVNSSFAHQVAKAAGINSSIIRRAVDVLEAMRQNTLPKEMDMAPPDFGHGKSREEVERQRQNFMRYMTTPDDDLSQMNPDEYFSLVKNI
ncbi:mutS protein homolog 5-like isoform X2 [Cloeon dipterum]|uniref:mutS protein homolog 5-like isoform X2 n=1 Tax=Cloeon dipterum TaxID=197152 RepID=UPI00322050EB